MADKVSPWAPAPGKGAIVRVVLLYGFFAALWILLSGKAVEWLFHDPEQIARAQMFKGFLFVAVTCLLLYRAMRGDVAGMFRMSRDVTELTRSEEDRREIVSAIANQASEGIVLIDCETLRFVEFNDATCKDLEYSREEFARLTLFDIQGVLTREEFTEHFRKVVEAGHANFENRQRRKDGTLRDVLINNRVIKIRDRKFLVALWQDITERKQAERELRESEEKFRLAFQTNPDPMHLSRLSDGFFLDINDSFTKITGYTRGDVIGKTSLELNIWRDPKDRQRLVAGLESNGFVENLEVEFCGKDGRLIIGLMSARLLRTNQGELILSVVRDITGRKQTEQALQESERRLRTILQTANEGFWLIDNDTFTRDVNPKMCAVLGRTREDVLGRKIYDFVDDKNRAIFEHQVRLRAKGELGSYEIALSRPDGSPVFCRFNVTPLFDSSMNKVGAFAMVTDITGRKQAEDALRNSEAKYRELFAAVSDAIVVSEAGTHQVLDVNESALRCYGYTREEFLNLKVPDMSAELEATRMALEEARIGQHQRIPLRYHRRKDGTVFPVEVSAVRFFVHELELRCSVIRDITERKRAEQEKEKLEAELHQARKMEAIGLLAGGIAHDFNNILAAIMGYSELSLLKVSEDSPIRGNLEQVLMAASRASDLVKQILTFTRRGAQERKPVSIAAIVADALKLLRATLPSTIEIRRQVEVRDGEDIVLADPGQIHQVLMNLGTNAAHAMRTRGGALSVKLSVIADPLQLPTHPDLKAGPHVCITMSDTGHGMDSTIVDRIFDPYFTTKGPGEGTGLGLSVVQGIVKGHNGAITVASEPGQGTSFFVFLPALENSMR